VDAPSGFGRPSDRKSITWTTGRPDRLSVNRLLAVRSAAPVAMPVLNGVLPLPVKVMSASVSAALFRAEGGDDGRVRAENWVTPTRLSAEARVGRGADAAVA